MSLGETFRLAREEKGLTISQVAEATRMMVQIVEDLEREDFRRIAAPIYGRGFIKLYAEHLGLDPEPLTREFMEIFTGSRPPQVVRREAEAPSTPDLRPLTPEPRPPNPEPGAPAAAPLTPEPRTLNTTTRPAIAPSASGEPDLFSVAAGRSEAVRSVADPAQPGETAPPRVRPAVAPAAATPRYEPAKPRDPLARDAPMGSTRTSSRPPSPWTPAVIGAIAAAALLLLVAVLLLLHLRHTKTKVHAARPTTTTAIKVERVLPPSAPYFD